MTWIYLTFFLSGFPALIYQLVWQRSLFTFFGTNIESVTVVVTAFMLGLGFGSLLGGQISKYSRISPLLAFSFMELGIALFGSISLQLFDLIGTATAGSSTVTVFLIAFSLVLIPTLLMGSTLPILTTFLVSKVNNVGRSVGMLYFVNTLGSAAACFAAAIWLFALFGKSGVVNIAVLLNVLVGGSAFALWFFMERKNKKTGNDIQERSPEDKDHVTIMSFPLGIILAGLIGFISLSYEILWLRVIMFTSAGWALAFPIFLGFFLSGIAFGSLFARKFCANDDTLSPERKLCTLAWFLFCANVIGYSVIPLLSQVITFGIAASVVFFILVALSSAMLGAILPLVAHYSISPDTDSGEKLSYLYMANIIGSASGSLITGFIFLDYFSIGQVNLFLTMLGFILAFALLLLNRKSKTEFSGLLVFGASLLLIVVLNPVVFSHVYERLQLKEGYYGQTFSRIVESKSGVITVDKDDVIWGGGGYDGLFRTDLVDDKNGIIRAYSLSAFHQSPKKVLMLGLASGSWAQVVVNNPHVESLTVIEINSGYLELIPDYPEVSTLLNNSKIEIIIDDGRRWLNAHSDRKFDVILTNTTLNWRSYVSNLLSKEFIGQMRSHMNPDGIVMYNGTCSPEVYKTAVETFPHAIRFHSMVVGSDTPINFDTKRWRETLGNYTVDGRLIFDMKNTEHVSRFKKILSLPEKMTPLNSEVDVYKMPSYCRASEFTFETKDTLLFNTKDYKMITDDNMGTEWLRQPWKAIVSNKKSYNARTAK